MLKAKKKSIPKLKAQFPCSKVDVESFFLYHKIHVGPIHPPPKISYHSLNFSMKTGDRMTFVC